MYLLEKTLKFHLKPLESFDSISHVSLDLGDACLADERSRVKHVVHSLDERGIRWLRFLVDPQNFHVALTRGAINDVV